MPITDISKDDIYSILGIIYTSSDYSIDEVNEQTEILNDVEKIIYTNIYGQLQTFIQNKETLKNEIDSELKDVLNKYKLNDGNDGDDNISVDSSEFENMLEEKIPESV